MSTDKRHRKTEGPVNLQVRTKTTERLRTRSAKDAKLQISIPQIASGIEYGGRDLRESRSLLGGRLLLLRTGVSQFRSVIWRKGLFGHGDEEFVSGSRSRRKECVFLQRRPYVNVGKAGNLLRPGARFARSAPEHFIHQRTTQS